MDNIKKNQVTIDDVEYAFEDMKPEQQAMVNHLVDLDRKIVSTAFNLDQLQVGKQAFIDMLKKSLAEVVEKVEVEVVQ
jgi:predicted transcriptional regulator